MEIRKLSRMPYAQAHVRIYDDGTIDLISYTTRVCTIDPQGWLTCTGTYSRTTIKHISAFMHEYGNGLGYYDAKKCYVDDIAMNLYSNMVKPSTQAIPWVA